MDSQNRGQVIRAPTPPRGPLEIEARQTLWTLARSSGEPMLRADLVGLADAAELETFRSGTLRRRWRFLRDTGARRYAERLRVRLTARGFVESASSLIGNDDRIA
jgi:hypothetical protein